MRYLRIALLLLTVAAVTQACIFVPVGPGYRRHHHRYYQGGY